MGTLRLIGKDAECQISGSGWMPESVTINRTYTDRETTNFSTPGDSKDFRLGRFNGTIAIETNLFMPWGAEITSGSLSAGKRYRVTAGTVGSYTVGRLFEATGLETVSTSNKVQLLPQELDAFDAIVKYNNAEFTALSATYTKNIDTVSATTNKTSGRGTEQVAGRAQSESTVTLVAYAEDYSYFSSGSVAKTFSIEFQSGSNVSVSGNAYIISENDPINTNEMLKTELTLRYTGAVVESNFMFVKYGEDLPFKIVLKRGTTSNREFIGKFLITSVSINANCETGECKMSVNGTLQGAVTENVYANA